MAMDAFTLHWAELRAYANPPWNLIGRVLADSPTASRACPGGTSVEGTGMVPSATGVLVKVQFLIPTVHGENRVGKVEAIPKLLRQFLEYAPPVVQGAPHAGGMAVQQTHWLSTRNWTMPWFPLTATTWSAVSPSWLANCRRHPARARHSTTLL